MGQLLLQDNALRDCDNLGENLTALGADTAGLFLPFLTGLGAGVRATRAAERASNIVLDTNAVIAAVEKGQSAAVLAGRVPIVPITVVKEFAAKGSIDALRSFLVAHGGRVAQAGSEATAAALRRQAVGMGRVLDVADSRVVASAMREGVPIVTEDRKLRNFLRAIEFDVRGFR